MSLLPDARAGGPRAVDHALCLYTRALHPELVPLARTRHLEGPGWRARAGLLRDTGHLIEVVARGADGRGEARATVEVLAPLALDLPAAGRIELRRVGASPSGAADDDSGVAYVGSWSFEPRPAEGFAALHARILEGRARGERLFVNRGHPENDGPAPFSILDVIAGPRRLETFVVHAFPVERAFFFLQSVFTLP